MYYLYIYRDLEKQLSPTTAFFFPVSSFLEGSISNWLSYSNLYLLHIPVVCLLTFLEGSCNINLSYFIKSYFMAQYMLHFGKYSIHTCKDCPMQLLPDVF